MGTYPIKERAKDAGIKVAHIVFGTIHFAARLAADAARELEAQTVHLIDNGCEVDLVRKQRDFKYEDRMEDFRARVAESRRVMQETFNDAYRGMSTEEVILATEFVVPEPPIL